MANATALSGRSGIQITIDSKQTDAAKLADTLDKIGINAGVDWTYGTGANQVNMMYHATLTATNAQAAVDISGSAIQDAFGDNCDFSALKLLYIKNTDLTEDLKLGGGVSLDLDILDDTSDIILIKPGGFLLWIDPSAAGLDVTTNKNMLIQAETAHVTYDIVLMGLKT